MLEARMRADITGTIRVIRVRRTTIVIEMPSGERVTLREGDTYDITMVAQYDRTSSKTQ